MRLDAGFAAVRWGSVLAFGGVIIALGTNARFGGVDAADLFWQGIMPLLPALLLIAPQLWRRICPVGAIGLAAARLFRAEHEIGRGRLPRAVNVWIKWNGVIAAAIIFWLIIPLRLLVFNEGSRATMALLAALGAAALALGVAGPWKSPWCSGICPLLPVEKFYGAAPLHRSVDTRCVPAGVPQDCYRCALHCLDVPQTDTRYRRAMNKAGSAPAVERARGFFVGSFPGLVLAYWLFAASPSQARAALEVYSSFLLLMLATYTCYTVAQLLVPERKLELVTVALSFNLYYAAVSGGVSTMLGRLAGWPAAAHALRVALILLACLCSLLWLPRAWRAETAVGTRW